MLQVEFPNRYILGVGWRPSFDINCFYILLINDFNWEEPVYSEEASDIELLSTRINQTINKIL